MHADGSDHRKKWFSSFSSEGSGGSVKSHPGCCFKAVVRGLDAMGRLKLQNEKLKLQ